MHFLIQYGPALAATIVIESALLFSIMPRGRRSRTALDAVFVNLTTHPIAWVLLGITGVGLWPIELGVWLVEASLFVAVSGMPWALALRVSLLANLLSTAAGIAWFG